MAGMTLRAASEPQQIVDRLIPKYHGHLMETKVLCLFRSKHKRKGGRQIWADARKVGGLMAFLADANDPPDETEIDPNDVAFFLIEFAEDLWPAFTDAQKEALCDHELAHLCAEPTEDGGITLKTRSHDLEEFCAVVERHGLWAPDVEVFAHAASKALQRSMFDEDTDE